jgi:nucleoside-diphosphate-sugar epimerase
MAMKVLITGGAGFIGTLLARRILELGRLAGGAVDELVLFDTAAPAEAHRIADRRVRYVAGEISSEADVKPLLERKDMSIFHLASVVSGGGEKDFDLAMRVNLHGHLHLLEAARALGSRPRYVFASSIAVFGGSAMPERVGDLTRQTPQTTYGMTKAIGELLVNDYTRKGFIDGRSARLPTVVVRPGKPNAAASSFASGVFREPLAGIECVLPVGHEAVMPLSGYRTIVENFIRLHEIDGSRLGDDRSLSFPALDVTVGQMVESLKRVGRGRRLGSVRVEKDPAIERIVATWPKGSYADRARSLSFAADADLDSVVAAYIADYVDKA